MINSYSLGGSHISEIKMNNGDKSHVWNVKYITGDAKEARGVIHIEYWVCLTVAPDKENMFLINSYRKCKQASFDPSIKSWNKDRKTLFS